MGAFPKGFSTFAEYNRFKQHLTWGGVSYGGYQIYDSFTRANSASAIGTATEKGGAWTAQVGTWGITSNQAYSVTSANGDKATIGLTTPASTITASITSDNCNNHVNGLIFRYVDANNFGVVTFFSGSMSIATVVGGAANTRATAAGAFTTAALTAQPVTITIASNVVTATVAGAQVTAGTQSVNYTLVAGEITAFGSGAAAGLFLSFTSGTNTAASVDNFTVA